MNPDIKLLICLAGPILFLIFLMCLHLGYLDRKDKAKKIKKLAAPCPSGCIHDHSQPHTHSLDYANDDGSDHHFETYGTGDPRSDELPK